MLLRQYLQPQLRLPDLAHLHLLAHLAGVPTEASLSYKQTPPANSPGSQQTTRASYAATNSRE